MHLELVGPDRESIAIRNLSFIIYYTKMSYLSVLHGNKKHENLV